MTVIGGNKITEIHLNRKAIIYIRQSSEKQVREHIESGKLQYALKDRVSSLGWQDIMIVDEDQGKSGAFYSERSGFQRVVALVGMGEAGIVMSLEATRMARNNRDWGHLIDLCSIFNTLIGDHQSIYDPKDPNDRLLLGVKGTMSEAELNLIKFRMSQGRLSKAKRGAFYGVLPAAYVLNGEKLVKNPDLKVRQATELIFNKFAELRSGRQTFLWFIDEKIKVPVRCDGRDMEGKKMRWQLPNYPFILTMLRNPIFAGAYAYGRTYTRISYSDGRIRKVAGHKKNREEWEVLIKDQHEGYIPWEQYEKNLLIMKNNTTRKEGNETIGAVRKGKGLLTGLLRCRRCGRKMHIRYWGQGGINPRYFCPGEFDQGGNYCQSFSAKRVDRKFEEELFKAIEPAAIEACIKACGVFHDSQKEKIQYLEKELEGAHYETNRAFTQYNQVDPLNRLVASELERRWNDKLRAANEVKERIEMERAKRNELTREDIRCITTLSDRLPEVWRHPDTDPVIKKRIIRTVVEEVVIHLDGDKPLLTMTTHWKGGVHTQIKFNKPVAGESRNKTDDSILELLKRLAPYLPDEEIARVFNSHKLKTGMGNPWTRVRVRSFRSENKIPPFDRTKKKDVLSLNEAANQLGVGPGTIRTLINNGILDAFQPVKFAPWQIPSSELEEEIVQKAIKRLEDGHYLKALRGVGPGQMSLFQ